MKIKHAVLIVGIVALLAMCVRADPAVTAQYYKPFEFQIDAFGELKTPDLDQERSAVGVGVNLFFTQHFGVGASTSFEDLNGAPFDNVSLRGIFRAPINRYAFYAFAGFTRQLDEGEWSLIGGPGFEARFTPRLGSFAEIGFDKQLTGARPITALARLGLRLTF